jgi:hypothetical protein
VRFWHWLVGVFTGKHPFFRITVDHSGLERRPFRQMTSGEFEVFHAADRHSDQGAARGKLRWLREAEYKHRQAEKRFGQTPVDGPDYGEALHDMKRWEEAAALLRADYERLTKCR